MATIDKKTMDDTERRLISRYQPLLNRAGIVPRSLESEGQR